MELQKSYFSGKFHGIPWNSGVWKKLLGIPWNTLDLDKIPWNSMELEVLLLKFHGIPWNHRCCSNVVQKIPWNFGESSMELFDQNNSTHSLIQNITSMHQHYLIGRLSKHNWIITLYWFTWSRQLINILILLELPLRQKTVDSTPFFECMKKRDNDFRNFVVEHQP